MINPPSAGPIAVPTAKASAFSPKIVPSARGGKNNPVQAQPHAYHDRIAYPLQYPHGNQYAKGRRKATAQRRERK